MGKNPAFQFYPNDWSRDLDEHPLEVEGFWIRVCCRLWWSDTPGKITKSLSRWSKSLGLHHLTCLKNFKYLSEQGIANIEVTFELPTQLPPSYLAVTTPSKPEVTDKLYTVVNRRMMRDHEIKILRSKCGTLGGNPDFEKGKPNPYYQKDKVSKADKQKITPSSSSSSSLKKPPTPLPSDFIKFWEAYPKKVGKLDAQKAWKKNGKPETNRILEAIAQQRASPQWLKDGGQFIPNPATWLNQGRWEDEVEIGKTKNEKPIITG